MTVDLTYFGMIQEVTQCKSEQLNLDDITVSGLIDMLILKYPKLKDMTFKVAVNQEIKSEDYLITNNCEVAILPPFAGG